MKDIEIAQATKIENIEKVAAKLDMQDYLLKYGADKGKIDFTKIKSLSQGHLILVTATSPTPYGEGKTTISIGLLDALSKLGYKATASLREPSMGPVFGMKGGATGGGYSQVIPMEEINLHFTGDFHAITAANNLLCAAIDNHIHQGNELNIDENHIMFNRCLDVNDRALKDITINSNLPHHEHFDITAASEIMAILCLSKNYEDLENRLSNILIAYSKEGQPLFAKNLKITGALVVLLKDALKPNLVQTLEHNPVLLHGGPFANIAHGCSSIIATETALKSSDYCITEAGFGSDLGGLKFYDIKSRLLKKRPDAVVLVTTIKALKYNGQGNLELGLANLQAHLDILSKFTKNIIVCLNKFTSDTEAGFGSDLGGLKFYDIKSRLLKKRPDAVVLVTTIKALKYNGQGNLELGLANLQAHLDILSKFTKNIIVCLNKFTSDTESEITLLKEYVSKNNLSFCLSTSYTDGSRGALALAKQVIKLTDNTPYKELYDVKKSLQDKIAFIIKDIYQASNINYTPKALAKITELEKNKLDQKPICIAKTQYSISDNKNLLGYPKNYTVTIRDLKLYNGAGYITVYLGNIITMPGLPQKPNYEEISFENNQIKGLF